MSTSASAPESAITTVGRRSSVPEFSVPLLVGRHPFERIRGSKFASSKKNNESKLERFTVDRELCHL
jgi:hypothetical protein